MNFVLDERYIIPFDREEWLQRIPPDVICRMGDSIERFFSETVNLWPWLGYGDREGAREVIEGIICMNYGAGESNFDVHINRCLNSVIHLIEYLRWVLAPPGSILPGVKDGRVVTGGILENMTSTDATFRVFYEAI